MATNINTIEDKDGNIILPRTSGNAVSYDNTTSGLTAASVQAGIDELSSEKTDLTDFNSHLADNASKIGDLLYTENNYITDSEPLTDSVDKLDMKIKDVLDGGSATPFTAMPYVGTAPIVESGSNANGRYIKYADGTMMCYAKLPITSLTVTAAIGSLFTSTAATSWTFPMPFYSDEIAVNGDVFGGGLAGGLVASYSLTLSAYEYRIANTTSMTLTGYIMLHAIGRWKA